MATTTPADPFWSAFVDQFGDPTQLDTETIATAVIEYFGRPSDAELQRLASAFRMTPPARTVDEAVMAIRADLEPVAKTERSQGTSAYNYRGRDRIVDALAPLMAKHGVAVVPTGVRDVTAEWVTDKNGRVERLVAGFYEFTVRGPAGDFYTTEIYAEGMNSRDKASGAAMSYAFKFALEMIFAIPTTAPDNDAIGDDPPEAATEEQLEALSGLFARIGDDARVEAKREFVDRFGIPSDLTADRYPKALKWVVARVDAAEKTARTAQSDGDAAGSDRQGNTPETDAEPLSASTIEEYRSWIEETFTSIDGATADRVEAALTEAGWWPPESIGAWDLAAAAGMILAVVQE